MSIPKKITTVEVSLLELLFDQAPDVTFFVKDREGRYVSVNQSLIARYGFRTKKDVIGKRIDEICPGELGRQPVEQDNRVLRTGRPLVEHLELHWSRPHQPVWCLTTKMPITDAAGKTIGLIGYSRDLRIPLDATEVPSDFAVAIAEFEQNLADHVTPAWLAKRAHLTTQRLTRLVKRLFGITPGQLISKTRIAAGSQLLVESEMSVAEISQACGFYDQSAFTRAFRSATGFSPTEFRQHRLGNQV
jgi:PAS domain S-box-containing protein